ncbi:MAG: hypothetical protein AAF493_17840 [Pseudomonadota bacterium]
MAKNHMVGNGLRWLALATIAVFSSAAHSAIVSEDDMSIITSTPSSGGGAGFVHNVFHLSTGPNGMGESLVSLDLDTNASNTWDTDTGDIQLTLNIFGLDECCDGTPIGSAVGVGNLNFDQFNQESGNSLGTISWNIDWEGGNAPSEWSGPDSFTQDFLDKKYGNFFPYQPNSYDDGFVTLWGAGDGIGLDLVFGLDGATPPIPAPIPLPIVLFGSAIMALIGVRRLT